MASDTAPAAVPEPSGAPDGAPAMGGRITGALASLLQPIDPARSTFDLTPDANAPADTGQGEPVAITAPGTSADYHTYDDHSSSGGSSSRPRVEMQSIWKAWLLAGAERWKKGADTRNKRLDVQKARAQAFQTKEARTVNRSEKIVGGATSSGTNSVTNAGKALNSKSDNGRSTKDTRKSNGAGHERHSGSQGATGRGRGHGASGGASGHGGGRGHGNGRGHGGGGGNGRHGGGGHGGGNGHDGQGKAQKPPKSPTGSDKPSPGSPGGGSGSKDAKGGAAGTGGAGKAGGPGKAGKDGSAGKDGQHRPGDGSRGGRGRDRVDLTKDRATSPESPDSKGGKGGKDRSGGAPGSGQQHTPLTGADGKPYDTRESREAGHRDGVRAARIVGHLAAYKDGVKDGWGDQKAVNAQDKARLDQAHADYTKTKRPDAAPEEDQDMAGGYTATPIEVVSIDAKNIQLGDGADRPVVSRGEVRNFVTFVARLEAKTDVMARVADATKGLAAEAEEQAQEVNRLLEQAKSDTTQAGENVIGKLARLADDAKAQGDKAADVHRRALRAAEACKTLLTNVRTRYEPVFRAVVDSPETRPAELSFYRDRGYDTAA